MTEIICYNQVIGPNWAQEWYESSTRHSRIRAKQLRQAGYHVICCGKSTQVTSVGLVEMSLVDIRGGDMSALPGVRIEHI